MTGTDAPKIDLDELGLVSGQRRTRGLFMRGASWYDRYGRRVGIGDLSAEDIERIAEALKPKQRFVVILSVTIDEMRQDHRHADLDKLDRHLLVDHACMVIEGGPAGERGRVHFVDHETVDHSHALRRLNTDHLTTHKAAQLLG